MASDIKQYDVRNLPRTLTHFAVLRLNGARAITGATDGQEVASASDIGFALGQLLHALHCAAGELGWLDTKVDGAVVQDRYALSFPMHRAGAAAGLGDVVHLFGGEADIACLLEHMEVRRLIAGRLFSYRRILPVESQKIAACCRYYRVQPITPAKERRRAARAEAQGRPYAPLPERGYDLPHCFLPSRSSSQRMTVFVGKEESHPASAFAGWANSYGLSAGGKGNAIAGYPGVVLPVFDE